MLLQPVMLVEVALLVVLCSLQVVLSVLNNLLDVLSEVNCIRHLPLVAHNDINQQPNLFPIHQLKWRAVCVLKHSWNNGKLHMTQQITPFELRQGLLCQ